MKAIKNINIWSFLWVIVVALLLSNLVIFYITEAFKIQIPWFFGWVLTPSVACITFLLIIANEKNNEPNLLSKK